MNSKAHDPMDEHLSVMKWVLKFLNRAEIQKISEAIQRAEAKTDGEIVPVIVHSSSTVGHVPLTLTLILLIFTFFAEFPWKDSLFITPWIYLWPVLGVAYFLISVVIARAHWVQRVLTPNYDEILQVNQRAQLEFFLNGVNKTRRATGILIFVSVMERRALILADQGIAAKIEAATWQKLVDDLTTRMRQGQWSEGFENCIAECGQVLSTHFPLSQHEHNELANQLVIKF